MPTLLFQFLLIAISLQLTHAFSHISTCRSYCGNITVDYPFTLIPGCGHPGFQSLFYCINEALMLHISSGSYRVVDLDYSYKSLTLHDPHMSTCRSILFGRQGNGLEIDSWRAQYITPTPDTIFMLLGCSARSPVFQGFSNSHLPCRNVSGMGCVEYYACPGWTGIGTGLDPSYGSGPPICCGLPFEAIKAINLSRLECEGYSSAYSVAPLRAGGANEWSYGIRLKYSLNGSDGFCGSCEATGGLCGHKGDEELCMCGDWNSTTNCDSAKSSSNTRRALSIAFTVAGGISIFTFPVWIY